MLYNGIKCKTCHFGKTIKKHKTMSSIDIFKSSNGCQVQSNHRMFLSSKICFKNSFTTIGNVWQVNLLYCKQSLL